MNSDGLSYKLLTSSSGGSMFSDSSSLFSNETKNHSRESSQRVIVSVDLIFASGRWRLSEESQDVLNFCLSNIVNARDCLFVVAIEVKRGKFTKENSQASMTNELESILAMWIKDANERRVQLTARYLLSQKWESGVDDACQAVHSDKLVIGTKHLASLVSLKSKKNPSHFLKSLPNCCEIIVVRKSVCVFSGRGGNGLDYPNKSEISQAPSVGLIRTQSNAADSSQLLSPSENREVLYSFDEIAKATGNFADSTLIGEGGCGRVHFALLRGKRVAIKRLKMDPPWHAGAHSDKVERFRKELELAMSLSHRNLLPLLGFCVSGNEYLVVYDFMENGSLDKRLRDARKPIISWSQRLHVACGLANALHYLHFGARQPYIHRDVKAGNVLLDENLEPYLADFDLAKVVKRGQEGQAIQATHIFGSMGYLDPDYHVTGKVSQKSDVYGYGVILWELITGLLPFDETRSLPFLTAYVEDYLKENGDVEAIIDPQLQGKYVIAQVERLAKIASLCCTKTSEERLDMASVVEFVRNTVSKEVSLSSYR